MSLLSEDGIFEKAERAAYETRKARFEERIGLVNLDAQTQKALNGSLTPEDYFEIVKDHGLISDATIGGDNVKEKGEDEEGNKVYEVTTEEGDVFEVTIDEEGNVETEYQGTVDGLPPRIAGVETSKTTNSITVKVTVNRLEGGEISYYIKKASEEEYPDEAEETSKDTSYIFEELEQNVTYDIKIVVENSKGSDEYETSEITGELVTGAITQKGETVWNNGEATIELETTETGYTIQYQVNGTGGTWQEYRGPITGLHHGDDVFVRLWDGINGSGETAITIQDGTKPTVNVTTGTQSTSSIQVSVSSSDNESGMPASPTYNYYIKPATQGDYSDTPTYTTTDTSYTFSGLQQNTSYNIKVTVADNAGNVGEGTTSGTTTGVGGAEEGLEQGNITVGETTWQNNRASITLGTSTNFMIQYKIGSGGTWTPASYSSGSAGKDVTVTGLSHNSIVYARLLDNANNAGSQASVTIQDGTKPTVNVTTGTQSTSSIQVSVSSSDNESGMPASPTYNYYIKPATQGDYSDTPTYTTTDTSYTFSGLQQNTSYNIKVTVADNAGNVGEGTTSGTTTGVGGAEEGLEQGNITVGETTWQNNRASITLSTSTNFMIQYKVGSDGTWTPASYSSGNAGQDVTVTNLSHNDRVYARLMDDAGNTGSEASVTIQDGTKPTVNVTTGTQSTSSIQVSVSSSDNESGMPASPTYNYYIKPATQGDYSDTPTYTTTDTSYTFSGLQQNTSYNIKVTVADNAGNVGEGSASGTTTGVGGAEEGLQQGNITVGETTWQNNRASITLSTSTNFMIQYRIGTDGTWTPASYSSGSAGKDVTVTGLSHNSIVYARLLDNANNAGSQASVTVLDGINPSTPIISLGTTSTTTGASITATVTHTDNQSGVATTSCKYIFNTTSGTLGTTHSSWNNAQRFTSNPQTINNLTASAPGTYYLHVLTVDNGGNMSEAVSQAVTVRQLATGISVSPTSVTLKEGETSQLTATVTPNETTNKGVTWSSDNSGVATVSNGLVRGVSAGTTIIRAKTTDGSNREATCSVTVKTPIMTAEDIAQEIASSPDKYYGKTVTGYEAEYGNVVGWKIFYAGNEFSSDGSYHVYLIADNYIPRENIPQSSGGHSLNAGNYPRAAYFTNILNDYSGSSSIKNAQIKKLNNDYFTKNYSSTNNNMRAVAYMLDTNVWSVYAGEDAQYAVGGPSIEMVMKSYSQKHGVDYRAQASGATGYQISNNGGSSWETSVILSTSDSLYVITSKSNAYGYWVASPSAFGTNCVMFVNGNDGVGSSIYDISSWRFPPPSLSKL